MIRSALHLAALGLTLGVTWIGSNAAMDALVARCWWPGVPAFACAADPGFAPTADLPDEGA